MTGLTISLIIFLAVLLILFIGILTFVFYPSVYGLYSLKWYCQFRTTLFHLRPYVGARVSAEGVEGRVIRLDTIYNQSLVETVWWIPLRSLPELVRAVHSTWHDTASLKWLPPRPVNGTIADQDTTEKEK